MSTHKPNRNRVKLAIKKLSDIHSQSIHTFDHTKIIGKYINDEKSLTYLLSYGNISLQTVYDAIFSNRVNCILNILIKYIDDHHILPTTSRFMMYILEQTYFYGNLNCIKWLTSYAHDNVSQIEIHMKHSSVIYISCIYNHFDAAQWFISYAKNHEKQWHTPYTYHTHVMKTLFENKHVHIVRLLNETYPYLFRPNKHDSE